MIDFICLDWPASPGRVVVVVVVRLITLRGEVDVAGGWLFNVVTWRFCLNTATTRYYELVAKSASG